MNRTEMRTLGRIGQPLSGGSYRPRRRFRAPRWLLVALSVALLAIVWVGFTANRQVGARPLETVAQVPARPDALAAASRSARNASLPAFASVDGLQLTLPHAKPVLVGFHEASMVEALELDPVGHLLSNDNATRYTPPADVAGPDYRVMSSRGRSRPATSAVDVAIPLGDGVVAPVTGTVTAVTEYPLYRRVRDWRVEITPAGREDLRVVLIHLLKPVVKVGDTVTAGEDSLAVARLLPFDSHIDYLMKAKQPHTHIEVKPAVESGPIDPNQPAAPADGDVVSRP